MPLGASHGVNGPTVNLPWTEAILYSYHSADQCCDCTEAFAGGSYEGDPDFWEDLYLDFVEGFSNQ